MSINYQFSPVIFSFKNRMRAELKGNQYKIMDTIADEVFLFQDTRLTLTKELSTRYLAGKTGICQPNIVRAVNKLEKKNFIRSVKSHIKGEGSLITIILDSTSISDNETSDSTIISNNEKSDSNLLSNQENLSKKKDQESEDLDSSLKINEEKSGKEKSHTCGQETILDSKSVVEESQNSSEVNQDKQPVINLLPARPVASATGNNEFTSLGSVLTSGVMNSPETNKTYGSSKDVDNSYSPVKDTYNTLTLSDKSISTGKTILLKKGFSPEEVSQITDRITASMAGKEIRNKNKYFLAACNNEKRHNSKVAVHNTSQKIAAPISRPSRPITTQKVIEKPVNPAEVLEKIKASAPNELFEVIMTVDTDKNTQRALEFLPGELKKEALAGLYLAAFKNRYPEIMEKI